MRRCSLPLSLCLLSALATVAWADVPTGMQAIQAQRVEASVGHLASDELEGRGSGADGGRRAGDWLAGELAALGLAPLGDGGSYFQGFQVGELGMRNVIASIPGQVLGQAIVIGAHYDHLGLGHQSGSLSLRGKGRIHNGADDNASGTAAVLEIARAFVASGDLPRRRLIFVWFDAEERGLLGSEHFVKAPPTDDEIVLMINLDMVGRLKRRALTINGATTGDKLEGWVRAANRDVGLELDLRDTMHSNSDHAPFYRRQIPVLVPFTGLHADYHRPSDDVEGVDADGVARIARLCYGVAAQAAESSEPIAFAEARDGTAEVMLEQLKAMLGTERFEERLAELRERLGLREGANLRDLADRLGRFLRGDRGDRRAGRSDAKPRLGVRIDTRAEAEGVRVRSVDAGSVAAAAGVQAGDAIVSFAGQPVESLSSLRPLVAEAQGRVTIVVARDGVRRALTADFGGGQDTPAPSPDGQRWF
jgi:hypothetical protein